ncbi:MAG: FGGY-family carbohydrate kinase [bacterium]
MRKKPCFIGVDVGSRSVRAAVFDIKGKMRSLSTYPIQIFSPRENFMEQSSRDIWQNTCKAVKDAVKKANIKSSDVKGIGFDATCSLVVLGRQYEPLPVSSKGNTEHNIIVWMDHRAKAEAGEINETGDEVLKYLGGKISPEMEIPKLLWLKRRIPETFYKAEKFLDLADFMVYRACGRDIRSVCTKACKWTYLAHEKRWSRNLFKKLNLEDLFTNQKLGLKISEPGEPAGCLSPLSANELGLTCDTVVAVGIIDAHAGGLGAAGAEPENKLVLISGTSSCHITVSRKPLFIPGVWGPYYGAMFPGMWLSEGGQSATGALIEHVIKESEVYSELKEQSESRGKNIYRTLNREVETLRHIEPFPTKDFHILGYFHGNRSPRANPYLKGGITGLSLNKTKLELARKYLAAIQSIAYGTRHIIETMNANGYNIQRIHMCGGGTKNSLWVQEHADITGLEIHFPREPEAVLLGSAVLGATAAGVYGSIFKAVENMTGAAEKYMPRAEYRTFHDRKYKVFMEMYADQMKYEKIMGK